MDVRDGEGMSLDDELVGEARLEDGAFMVVLSY